MGPQKKEKEIHYFAIFKAEKVLTFFLLTKCLNVVWKKNAHTKTNKWKTSILKLPSIALFQIWLRFKFSDFLTKKIGAEYRRLHNPKIG